MSAENDVAQLRSLYLELMKKCLTDMIYQYSSPVIAKPATIGGKLMARYLLSRGIEIVQSRHFDENKRNLGMDWPPSAHTMIGLERLNNLQFCAEKVLENEVPGDLFEAGIWRGGAVIFMRAILKAYNVTDRCVWGADSFEGLPPPNPVKYSKDAGDIHHTWKALAVSLDEVQANFEKYGLLDNQVHFLRGWFRDTLPIAPIKQLAVLRLDGDMYESTMEVLVSLYPRLSPGGYVIIDDYGAIAGCREAVHDYRDRNGISDQLVKIDWTGVYWQRS